MPILAGRGKRLRQNDQPLIWNRASQPTPALTKENFEALPDTLQLRLVRWRIEQAG
jgi:hypothetical protein